jgi:hypothetical protein
MTSTTKWAFLKSIEMFVVREAPFAPKCPRVRMCTSNSMILTGIGSFCHCSQDKSALQKRKVTQSAWHLKSKRNMEPGMMAHICNPCTQKVEAGGSGVQG